MADFEWTPERDDELRTMRGKGMRNNDIAEAMGTTFKVVDRRVSALQLPPLRRRGGPPRISFWTAERDALLREMWTATPQPSVNAIRCAFGYVVSVDRISYRAIHVLKLEPRKQATPPGAVAGDAPLVWTDERNARLRQLWNAEPRLELKVIGAEFGVRGHAVSAQAMKLGLPKRNPKKGGYARTRSTPYRDPQSAKLHIVVAPDETPCPYFDPFAKPNPETGKIDRCGVMVNRRLRRDGTKPGQYCAEHAKRVSPVGGGDGTRAGARFLGPVTRAGIVGRF